MGALATQTAQQCGTACETESANTASHMVDALTYLIDVASDSGYLAVASRLRSARSDLMVYQTGYAGDDGVIQKSA